jgi:NADH-quinone oxidoreductase subunit L
MVFLTFFGALQQHPTGRAGWRMNLPLVVLAVLAIVAGFVELPPTLGDQAHFTAFLGPVLPAVMTVPARAMALARLQLVAGIVSLGGISIAWALFLRSRAAMAAIAEHPVFQTVHRFWRSGWGFDWLYDHVFVQPLVWFASVDSRDGIDRVYDGLAWSSRAAWRALSNTETGSVRWYAAGLTIGALVVMTIIVIFL